MILILKFSILSVFDQIIQVSASDYAFPDQSLCRDGEHRSLHTSDPILDHPGPLQHPKMILREEVMVVSKLQKAGWLVFVKAWFVCMT